MRATVAIAAERGLRLPLVYNTGGYDSLEALALLDGIVDIYMPDMKCRDVALARSLARKYSHVRDHIRFNQAAVCEMHRQVGDLMLDDQGIAQRGLLVRHLVLVGFDGIERVIAHVDFPKVHRVGKYGVDVRQIDEAADRLIRGAADVYLIDEIGKMECLSDRLVNRMRILFDGLRPVIATVARHGNGFIKEVKRAEGVVLWEVNHANRDRLAVQLLQWLMEDGSGE